MKKILFALTLFISTLSYSQVNPHAIGVRLGGSHYGHYGGEISYQHGFGDANRLEVDLGWRNHKNWSSLGVAVVYHWVWNITDGLNWYVGPGGHISMYSGKDNFNDGFGLALGGQIGIEYDFNQHGAPLLLSLDARPMWNFIGSNGYGGFGYGSALGIRYTF
ncbi:MAG: hypothetical protein ABJG68_11495 [Crocinitomicaceae bacterium]